MAYLMVKALRAWASTPERDAIVREICGIRAAHCLTCIGKANAIMGLYEDRSVRP